MHLEPLPQALCTLQSPQTKVDPCTARFRSAKAISFLHQPLSQRKFCSAEARARARIRVSRTPTARLASERTPTARLASEPTQRCRRRARQHSPARDTVGHTAKAPTKCFPQASRNNVVGAGTARGSPDRSGSPLRLRSDDSAHSARFRPQGSGASPAKDGSESTVFMPRWPTRQPRPACTCWNQEGTLAGRKRVDRSPGPKSAPKLLLISDPKIASEQ